MQFIIKANEPFRGHAESVLTRDGRVAYTGQWARDEKGRKYMTECLTLAEYEAREGCKMRVINEEEMMELERAHMNSMVTDPKPVTRTDYDYALNVLPPCRWHGVAGFSVFHVSERITGNLVDWYAQGADGRYWHFVDYDYAKDDHLAAKLRGAGK